MSTKRLHNSNNTQKLTHSLSPVQFSLSKQKKKKKYTLTIAWYSVAEWNDKRSKQIDSLIRVVTVSYKQWHVCSLSWLVTQHRQCRRRFHLWKKRKNSSKRRRKKNQLNTIWIISVFFFRRRLFPLYDFWAHWNFALFFEKSEVLFCIRAIWLIIFLMSYEKKKKWNRVMFCYYGFYIFASFNELLRFVWDHRHWEIEMDFRIWSKYGKKKTVQFC